MRKLLEGVIAPSIGELRARLDALDKDVQELGGRVDRLDGRVDRLTGTMEDGFARLNGRLDGLNARLDALGNGINACLDALTSAMLNSRQATYPDSIRTRLEALEREIQESRKA